MDNDKLEELLLTVQKPARYIGGEWNSVKKEWTEDRVKVLLAFPDVYEVGMSYLGMKILYGILNGREDCLCERVFSPWIDFEDGLRKNNLSLFSLESRRPIKEFDIIGFSLAYELNYTNVLNIMDLGGIPVWSRDRTDSDPIIIAGGPSCYNPEPMAEFIDAFVIGEGEEVIGEIVNAYKEAGNGRIKREGLLRALSKIRGVYVPSLYRIGYNDDKTIKDFSPIEGEVSSKIEKRFVADFENAFYPAAQIVPYIQIVHDRIAIEILRGCKHCCKFCLSGAAYRPRRERSEGRILKLAEESYEKTGYEEISLLSLSSGEHSRIRQVVESLNEMFKGRAVGISVPSLRVDNIPANLPVLLAEVRKAGLTFAPESGSERLRRYINKDIDIEKLIEAVAASFRAGWNRVKLYFMIGIPTESDEDIIGIAEIMNRISNLKKAVDGKPGYVTASINAFIPKPHTAFQRSSMEGLDGLYRKRRLLKEHLRSMLTEANFHSFEHSYLEAVFSRGDRRLSGVIYEAWRRGAKFDGWLELFNMETWRASFAKTGVEPDFYSGRARMEGEILPWAFVAI